MEQLLGNQLGKYQLRAEIGRGGMAAVYHGYDTVLQRDVAIKVMAQYLSWEPDSIERLLREARAAAQLKHPNIITVFDIGHEGNWHYIVMELIDGCSLKDWFQQTPQPPLAALQILEQIATALDYAHACGVVHRDVKPGNILIERGKRAVLTDFGIAKAAHQTRLTAAGLVVGTPEYLAPEQARGMGGASGSDIYSLGIIAYQILGGSVPFEADDTLAVLYKHVHEPPPPIRQFRPDLPEPVEGVLQRVLAKDPAARYPSAGAFVEALRRALGGEEVEPPPQAAAPLVEEPTTILPAVPDTPAAGTMPAAEQPAAGKRCVFCDEPAPADAQFCSLCGRPWVPPLEYADPQYVTSHCLRCNRPVLSRGGFCPYCGESSEADFRQWQADVYGGLLQTMGAGRWAEAARLAEGILEHRDAWQLQEQARQSLEQERQKARTYQRLRAARQIADWEQVIEQANTIPGYRDVDQLLASAEAELAKERRRAETYRQLQAAVQSEEWAEAVRLAQEIPGYEDADRLQQEAQQSLDGERKAGLYRDLVAAMQSRARDLAVLLADTIPSDGDAAALRRQAEPGLEEKLRADIRQHLHASMEAQHWSESIQPAEPDPGHQDADQLWQHAEDSREEGQGTPRHRGGRWWEWALGGVLLAAAVIIIAIFSLSPQRRDILSPAVPVRPSRATPSAAPPAARTPTPPTETPISTVTPLPQARARRAANLRSGPGTQYDVVGHLDEGDVVTVLAAVDGPQGIGWLLVQTAEGAQVWVHASLVEVSLSLDLLPTARTVLPTPHRPTAAPSPTPAPPTPLPTLDPNRPLDGTWSGTLTEISEAGREFRATCSIRQLDSSSFGGTMVFTHPDGVNVESYEILDGYCDGVNFRFRESQGRHYWGALQGNQISGKVAWHCYDCSHWGVFVLSRP